MDVAISTPYNQEFCKWCRDLFAGHWEPWRVPTSPDGRWKIYKFHDSLECLRECAKTHRPSGRCPLCAVAVARGDWGTLGGSTEMTFSHIREENYLSINITPEGATSQFEGCFITMTRGTSFQA